jgi:hypothetical protein
VLNRRSDWRQGIERRSVSLDGGLELSKEKASTDKMPAPKSSRCVLDNSLNFQLSLHSTQTRLGRSKMVKRKRGDHGDPTLRSPAGGALPAKSRQQMTVVEAKLEASVKSLQSALKLAVVTERRKLGKRKKDAEEKRDPSTIARLDAESKFLEVCLRRTHCLQD